MDTKRLIAIFLFPAVFALAGCGGGTSTETVTEAEGANPATAPAEGQEGEESPSTPAAGKAERSVKVEIANFAYSPDPVRVAEGGKVIWLNNDTLPHTATADDGSFDTGTIDEGKLKSETFKEAGTFTYHCEIHPQMHGTIEVVPAE